MTNNNNYTITKTLTRFCKSISEDKNMYSIDTMLLLELGNNNWIGIVFRDYTNNNDYIQIECDLSNTDICTSDINSERD